MCTLLCGLEACVIVSCFVFCGDVDLDQEVGRWTQVRAIGRRKEKHTNTHKFQCVCHEDRNWIGEGHFSGGWVGRNPGQFDLKNCHEHECHSVLHCIVSVRRKCESCLCIYTYALFVTHVCCGYEWLLGATPPHKCLKYFGHE